MPHGPSAPTMAKARLVPGLSTASISSLSEPRPGLDSFSQSTPCHPKPGNLASHSSAAGASVLCWPPSVWLLIVPHTDDDTFPWLVSLTQILCLWSERLSPSGLFFQTGSDHFTPRPTCSQAGMAPRLPSGFPPSLPSSPPHCHSEQGCSQSTLPPGVLCIFSCLELILQTSCPLNSLSSFIKTLPTPSASPPNLLKAAFSA